VERARVGYMRSYKYFMVPDEKKYVCVYGVNSAGSGPKPRRCCSEHTNEHLLYVPCLFVCFLFVFLALQPIVVVFSQPGSGL
jgi:hypothetical protein